MPFTDVGDLSVYYETKGEGPRVLYIPGTSGDLRRVKNGLNTPLATHFDVLSYDQRGLGQTSKPDNAYTMKDYADDAAGLLDALGWETCHVIGGSFGGMVAQELAIRYPGKVSRLVLACSSSGGAGGSSYPLHELFNLEPAEQVMKSISRTDMRLDESWQKDHPEEFGQKVHEGLTAFYFARNEPGAIDGKRRQLEARSHFNTYDRLSALDLPVLVCGGKYDGQAEPAVVENLAIKIPGADLKYFEGGHMFLQQDPAAYQAVITFFKAG
ncbi:MAG: alpha/beta hydrolase [Rhodospirillales bacterium]|nr:alpha/beta hydrolase [Rhodospirillales bacterium]